MSAEDTLNANEVSALASVGELDAYNALSDAGYATYIRSLVDSSGYSIVEAVVQGQFKQGVDEVHALALTLSKLSATDPARAGIESQLSYWLGQIGGIKSKISTLEMPSSVLVTLDKFSDDAIATAKGVGVAVGASLGGVEWILEHLPEIALVVVVLVVGFLIWRHRSAAA